MEDFVSQLLEQAVARAAEDSRDRGNNELLHAIQSSDPMEQLSGLTQLCDQLNMNTMAISSFAATIPMLISPLLRCIKSSPLPEVSIMAARALAYTLDSFPRTQDIVLRSESSVSGLLKHLRMIEDVELSEQCLMCLDKLSNSPAGARCIRQQGGVEAILAFTDFFTLPTQRRMWDIVVRALKSTPDKNTPSVLGCTPIIRQAISSEDVAIRDRAIVALERTLKVYRNDEKRLEEVFGDVADRIAPILTLQLSRESAFTSALSLILSSVMLSDALTASIITSGLLDQIIGLLEPSFSSNAEAVGLQVSPASPQSPLLAELQFSPTVQSQDSPTPYLAASLSAQQSLTVCHIFAELLAPCHQGVLQDFDKAVKICGRSLEVPESNGAEDDGHDSDENNSSSSSTSQSSDDEEDAVAPTSFEIRRDIDAEKGIHILSLKSHAECLLRIFSCDGCGATLQPTNWFRCNDCNDTDFCGACLLQLWKEHFDGKHAFTDMNVLAERRQNGWERNQLFKATPALLQRVLRAVPIVIDVCLAMETTLLHKFCFSFLANIFNVATTEQLSALESDVRTKLCELLTINLRNPHLVFSGYSLGIIQILVEKMPESFRVLLMREGVKVGLKSLNQRCRVKRVTPLSPERRSKLTSSLKGWQTIIGTEAANLLQSFSAIEEEESSCLMSKVVEELKQEKFGDALAHLRQGLEHEMTAYELSSSGVFATLITFLQKQQDVRAIAHLVAALSSKDEQPRTSPLSRLVHHLHATLTHLDNFQSPSLPFVTDVRQSLAVVFIRDEIASNNAETRDNEEEHWNSSTGDSEWEDNESDEEGVNWRSPRGGRLAVRIAVMTSVSDMIHFLQREVVHHYDDEEADGNVEEILPELQRGGTEDGADGRGKARLRRSQASRPPNIWIRYRSHVLPLSFTMLQLLQHFIFSEEGQHRGGRVERATGRGRGATLSAGFSVQNPIELHYSTTPYRERTYPIYNATRDFPSSGNPKADLRVRLPSTSPHPEGFYAVMDQLSMKYPYSGELLSEEQKTLITLLCSLHAMVQHWSALRHHLCQFYAADKQFTRAVKDIISPSVCLSDFVNAKLNNKALRCCSKVLLAGQQRGTWAVKLALDCGCFFTPHTRKFMFDVSFTGTDRSLIRVQGYRRMHGLDESQSTTEPTRNVVQRLEREKRRVWREDVLACAEEVLGSRNRSSGASVWEFEFYNERGSGLGPTREFYSLVALKLQERKLGLWRSSDEVNDQAFYTPLRGLYPNPVEPGSSQEKKIAQHFQVVGHFISRALLDEHIPTLSFSSALIKMLRGDSCGLEDLFSISESVGQVIFAIAEASRKSTNMLCLSSSAKRVALEDLMLDFSVPGSDDIELKRNGAKESVTESSMMEYCDAVVSFLLKKGVKAAVQAMREGFHLDIPLVALRLLTVEEIHELIAGHASVIPREDFEKNVQVDHGYTLNCRQVQWLLDILASFTVEDQKRFFFFLTGSPHLPVGGLSSLRPKLTIVRKPSSDPGIKESDQLPSAMTCQNYLKLPEYDSKEQMETKLRMAMVEGSGAFLLT